MSTCRAVFLAHIAMGLVYALPLPASLGGGRIKDTPCIKAIFVTACVTFMAGFAPLAFSPSDYWVLDEGKVGSRVRDVGGFLAFVAGMCFTVEGLLDLRDVEEDRCALKP